MRKVFLFASLLATIIARGQGTLVYDQQSATNTALSGGGFRFNNLQPMGQSFTPVLSGIGFIQFEFADVQNNGLGSTVYVNLLENSISGNVLASTLPVFMPDHFFGATIFFFSLNVPLTSGVTYYLQPILLSGDAMFDILGDYYNYQGGTSFFLGASSPDNTDLWFREGIVVPRISIKLTNSQPLLRFATFSNQNYSVEYSPDLSSGSWSNLLGTNIQGNGQDAAVLDTNVTMSINRFYRLKLVP